LMLTKSKEFIKKSNLENYIKSYRPKDTKYIIELLILSSKGH
jgi:hypothetical protein